MPEYGREYVGFAKPKCGSTAAHRILVEHDHASRRAGQHDPCAKNRGLRVKRIAVAPDRNPLSWYPSVYAHFMATLPSWGAGVEQLDDIGGRDFKSVLYALTHGMSLTRVGIITEAGEIDDFAASGVGLATWMSWWTYGERREQDCPSPDDPWAVDVIVPMSRLVDGYSELLGVDVSDVGQVNVRTGADNMPADYMDWYTSEMVEWVRSADRHLFRVLGCDGWSPSTAPVISTRGRTLAWGEL